MTTSDHRPAEDEERKKGVVLIVLLGAVLAVGTIVGVAQAVDSTTTDRVAPASTAPVYGTP